MMKVDVAVQSYKKPESMIYTLLSLKKYCGECIDTIYVDDDCSDDGTVEYYDDHLREALAPIRLEVRINRKRSLYTKTLMTKKLFRKKRFAEKLRLLGHMPIKRLRWMPTEDDIRYQWAIQKTDKPFIMLIHDDIKFFDNVVAVYLAAMEADDQLAIVGDLGGSKRCPFGPCGGNCSPLKILEGQYPCQAWPITGRLSIIHTILGRYKRNCRINEWCCMLRVDVARKLTDQYGICFGNYEGGGDVGTYWFEKIIKLGYHFTDPLPTPEMRKNYYLHWWQGHEGHQVWVDYNGNGKAKYEKEFIVDCIKNEFQFEVHSH